MLRSIFTYFTTVLVFGCMFAWAPADDLRACAVAFVVGAFMGVILQHKSPGWNLFCMGSAFTAVGLFHATTSSMWIGQAMLLIPTMLSCYFGERLGEDMLDTPGEAVHGGQPFFSLARLRREERRGLLVMAGASLGSFAILTPLASGAHYLAFPVGFTLTLAMGIKWRIRRQFWPMVGLIAGLVLSGGLNIYLAQRLNCFPPQLPDPWLSGGLLSVGASIGLWLSIWYRQRIIGN